jgi:putative addiction module killer protein
MAFEVRQTQTFAAWLDNLRDRQARARVIRRIDRLAATASFGDVKPVGSGVSEMRINFGPGYRIYSIQRGAATVTSLGGDKSTQSGSDGDIARGEAVGR